MKIQDMINKCHTPLREECPKHHRHKGDPGAIPGTCDAVGVRAQVDPSVGEGPKRWERLPPMETRRKERGEYHQLCLAYGV